METSPNTIENAIKLASPHFAQNGSNNEIEKIKKQWDISVNSNVCLLVCGEFKRGKSTFVNALIGRDLCATDTDICTSVVSIIKYAETECVVRYYGDFSNPKSQNISLDELETYTVGTAEEIDNTIYVEIGLPLPSLKDGIVVIDTPGVGGLDPRHATLTNFFIPKADIALFMTDVNEPMTTTELNFLKSKILPYARQSAIVVNKADLRNSEDVENFRLDTINKIASFTQIQSEKIIAVSVSSAAEAYPDNDFGDSNFPALRKMIASLIENHRKTMRCAIKANFIELLNLNIAPLQAQLQQIEQPDVNQIDELNKQKAEIDKKIAELSDSSSEFRMSVSKAMTCKREEITNYLNEMSVTLQSETFPALVQSPQARSDNGGEWLGSMLNDAIAEIGSNLTLMLDKAFDDIAAMPQFEGMLNFDTKGYTSNVLIRNVDTSVPMNKRITPLMSGVGIVSFGAMLLTGVAFFAALGVGAYVALKNSRDAGHAHIESRLRQAYQPQLSAALSSLNNYVSNRFTEFQQEWIGVITGRCKAYRTSVQNSIANIQQVKQAINQAVNMRVQIQNKLKPLLAARDMASKTPD